MTIDKFSIDEVQVGDMDVEKLPYKTAPEHAEDYVDDLGLSEEVRHLSLTWSMRYGVSDPIGKAPHVVAAGAVYAAALMRNEKVTQKRLNEVSGAHTGSIRRSYRTILMEEGLNLDGPDETNSNERESFIRNCVKRLKERLR
jgi:transcription initiation factor TFIIIB Brf1 subunit/transcription initiation factor TFIIB